MPSQRSKVQVRADQRSCCRPDRQLGISAAKPSAVPTPDLPEVQSLDVVHVEARKAADAFAQFGEPALVDDTGLSIHGWNGLPGALVAWFLDTVGPQGILDMAAGLTDRRATVTVALGYADATGVRVFQGTRDRIPGHWNHATPPASATTPSSSRQRHQPPHLRADDQ
jgi:inosine/xanthosine triphosphate pyrophosphatase family protein